MANGDDRGSPYEPPPSDLEELLDAAANFGKDPQERQEYLEALRNSGASDEYVEFVEDYMDARDGIGDAILDFFGDVWQWLGELFGVKDARSG